MKTSPNDSSFLETNLKKIMKVIEEESPSYCSQKLLEVQNCTFESGFHTERSAKNCNCWSAQTQHTSCAGSHALALCLLRFRVVRRSRYTHCPMAFTWVCLVSPPHSCEAETGMQAAEHLPPANTMKSQWGAIPLVLSQWHLGRALRGIPVSIQLKHPMPSLKQAEQQQEHVLLYNIIVPQVLGALGSAALQGSWI